jgi:hypothetical protein
MVLAGRPGGFASLLVQRCPGLRIDLSIQRVDRASDYWLQGVFSLVAVRVIPIGREVGDLLAPPHPGSLQHPGALGRPGTVRGSAWPPVGGSVRSYTTNHFPSGSVDAIRTNGSIGPGAAAEPAGRDRHRSGTRRGPRGNH